MSIYQNKSKNVNFRFYDIFCVIIFFLIILLKNIFKYLSTSLEYFKEKKVQILQIVSMNEILI